MRYRRCSYPPIYILGHVASPGAKQFRPGLTVLQALSLSGGVFRPSTESGLKGQINMHGDLEDTRNEMYRQTISLAKRVGYYSVGTVEFIVDQNRKFYFLEMNTRLQVEHCVTELITGIDLVEQMIKIAAGERLSFTQKDVKLNGWAIESRIYAEDPSRGFLPSSGRITEYSEPNRNSNIRIDTGVNEGGEVSMFYDAMISKLCTHAETRSDAIKHMQNALGDYIIRGISHNISFLEAIMAHPRFLSGDISTNFIQEEYPEGFLGAELTSEASQNILASAIHVFLTEHKRNSSITGHLPGRKHQTNTRWVVTIDKISYTVVIKPLNEGNGYNIRQERQRLTVRSNWVIGSRLFRGIVNDRNVSVRIEHFAGGYYFSHAGTIVEVTVRSPRIAELEKFMLQRDRTQKLNFLHAPISGLVVAIKVEIGDKIKPGQEIAIIEAMKINNSEYRKSTRANQYKFCSRECKSSTRCRNI
ncbi:MAG: hypothetical protein EOP45_17120 [Sphingobacteriaceae bacterium]|nr:MAG: hypothetical protein EOP45_17120 [Sphingobacteriaceae bacterium]